LGLPAIFMLAMGGIDGRKQPAEMVLSETGICLAFMLILYGAMRFGNEMIRDDNPFEFDGLTISQSIAIFMVVAGAIVLVVCRRMKPWAGVVKVVQAKGRK